MEQPFLDRHGPEWRQWLLNQIERGCAQDDLLSRMTAKVWSESDALHAIDECLALAGKSATWRVPLPAIADSTVIGLEDRRVTVLGRIQQPRAALLDGVLSLDECSELIHYAKNKKVQRSGVIDRDSGTNVEHPARTSSTVFLHRDETALITRIENILCELSQWPKTHGEGLQILFYDVGQQYKAHFDWFDLKKPGAQQQLKRGGQRVATTIIYLSNADSGGATYLPEARVRLQPRPGGAVFFNNLTLAGKPDNLSLHCGEPVQKGLKVIATYWQRESEFK
jgi:prolyl 4-hydroxylase